MNLHSKTHKQINIHFVYHQRCFYWGVFCCAATMFAEDLSSCHVQDNVSSSSSSRLGGLLWTPSRSCVQARGRRDPYFEMCLGHQFHLRLFLLRLILLYFQQTSSHLKLPDFSMTAMNLLLAPDFLCPGACPPAPPATESAAGLLPPSNHRGWSAPWERAASLTRNQFCLEFFFQIDGFLSPLFQGCF